MVKMDSKFRAFTLPVLCGCLIIAVAGCSKNKAGAGGFAFPPMPVEVSQVVVQRVADKFEGVGTIEAVEAITVVSEIDAAVETIPFVEGGFLKKGDLIAQLNYASLGAEAERAEALRAQSQVTYDRVKAIVDQKAGAPQDLDDAAAALRVAEANLTVAKARLSKTRIVAPFDGMVGARQVSIGTFLRAGQAVTVLANIDAIRVNFSVPERFLSRLTRGADVAVSTTAYPGYELKGKIIVVNPVLDQSTRSARVVAQMANPGRKFRSGMSANVSVVLGERANAMTIPNEAVFASGGQSFVFVVKSDSIVARVPLSLGTRLTNIVEVLEGLEPGMSVVTAGHQKLFEGAKVMPMPNTGAPPSTPTQTKS